MKTDDRSVPSSLLDYKTLVLSVPSSDLRVVVTFPVSGPSRVGVVSYVGTLSTQGWELSSREAVTEDLRLDL